MTSLTVIENKISSIQKYLKILAQYKDSKLEDIKKDDTLRGAIERYLYLVVQGSIDLSEAVIAHKSFRKPTIYSECFEILHEEKVIDEKLKIELIKMVGFRNIIAHDYESVNLEITQNILKEHLRDIENFIETIRHKYL